MNPENGETWSLEVVRGAETGRRFPLGRGRVMLGNSLGGTPGLDLSGLEIASPRKMAARHAHIDVENGSLSLRDLNSPGGTFVDRRRVPPGSDLPLKNGDLIQLGGVQLRVVSGAVSLTTTTTPIANPHAVLTLSTGVSCRTWDDVLTFAAQRWNELRDELTSGRLAAGLIAAGRPDLAPDARAEGSPDERLDRWIGRLPTTQAAKPELDVHPRTVIVKAASGGGIVRKTVRVNNVGYRLMKTSARVEPIDATWLRLTPEFDGKAFNTVEQTELSFDVAIPDTLIAALTATIVLEGNGGGATISIRLEPATAKEPEPLPQPLAAHRTSNRIGEWIGRQSQKVRLITWPMVAVVLRGLVGLSAAILPSSGATPTLSGPLLLFAVAGSLIALLLGAKGSESRDHPWLATGGAFLGAMSAALFIALCRVIEAPVSFFGSPFLIWAVLGAALAFGSTYLVPPRPSTESKP